MDLSHNQFTILDVSDCSDLTSLICDSNQLTNLNLSKNEGLLLGIGEDQELSLSNMPDLCEVCVWELPFPLKESMLIQRAVQILFLQPIVPQLI